MRVSAKLSSMIIGGALVLVTAGAAMATPAVVTGTVNVRSGPSTGYHRVDTLHRGQQVDVRECQGSWCYIVKSGPDGWVSANYLQRARGHYAPRPSVNFSFSFGSMPRPSHHGGNNHHGGNDNDGHHDGGWNGGWDNDWN